MSSPRLFAEDIVPFRARAPLTGHEASPRVLGLPEGRHAEEPFELPAELRWALVADRPRGGARVVPVVGHEPPRLVEPDSLEVLQGGAGRHELEVVMEGRHAHARPLRRSALRTWRSGRA